LRVAHVGHQHLAAEPRDQRFFPILTAARTVIASEARHAIQPFSERRRARDHLSGELSTSSPVLLPEYVALSDRAAHSANLDRRYFCSAPYNVLPTLFTIDNGGFAACPASIQIDGNPSRTTFGLPIQDNRTSLEIDVV
jgi:hypothetical protein